MLVIRFPRVLIVKDYATPFVSTRKYRQSRTP